MRQGQNKRSRLWRSFLLGAALASGGAPALAVTPAAYEAPPGTSLTIQGYIVRGPHAGGKPQQLIVLSHGRYGKAASLLAAADLFSERFPHALLVLPSGPFPVPGSDGGYRQWYSIADWSPARRDAVPPPLSLTQIRQAGKALNDFIDAQLERTGLDDSDVVLLGFSQGGVMSLYAGMHRTKPVAAIMAFSGFMVNDPVMKLEAMQKPPVYLVHGEDDDVVDISYHWMAERDLAKSGFDVRSYVLPGRRHVIEGPEIELAAGFLQDVFSATETHSLVSLPQAPAP